jgi:hypothetical protein
MKLAEALILRADHQKRIMQIKERLLRNAQVQEGEQPAEQPTALLAELEQTSATLVDLIQRINRTNSRTHMDDGRAIADAIAERDGLRWRADILREFTKAATVTQARYGRNEIKFYSTVSVVEMQRQADALSVAHRELDAAIQALNWTTELAE